jgi:hypothetical protein
VFDITTIPYLPTILPALVAALASWIAAQRMARSNEKIASVKRADDDRKERVDHSNHTAEDLTARFRLLMDGYANRVKDLTDEVEALRSTVEALKEELAHQRTICRQCPHFRGHDGTD